MRQINAKKWCGIQILTRNDVAFWFKQCSILIRNDAVLWPEMMWYYDW